MTDLGRRMYLNNPEFRPWDLLENPGTSHDGWHYWEFISDTEARIEAVDEEGNRRSWMIYMVEELE